MKLQNLKTGEEVEAEIVEVEPNDYKIIKISKNFSFDWKKEEKLLVYKIRRKEGNEILGLLSLIDVPQELRIHINLIESSIKHRGKDKELDRIPGCLIAFTSRESFAKGYGGFISLTPKTKLVDYYVENYGFSQYGRNLALEGKEAAALINKFLES
ncbi:MAG: hypothetical protein AB8B69_10190 [Chitinophagales bacterium]